MLLDDHVELQYALDDLPMDGRDPRVLIAFLKAMEFTSLTRRVGEATGTDPNMIDAEPALRAGASPASGGCAISARAAPSAQVECRRPNCPSAFLPWRQTAGARLRNVARSLRRLRSPANARKMPPDRKSIAARYETVSDRRRARAMDRASDRAGPRRVDPVTTSPDPMISALCGFALALGPNKAAYVPLSHRRRRRDLLAEAVLAAGQIDERDALDLLKPLLEDRGVLKIGHDLKQDALVLARHGIALSVVRRHHADVLRARCRPRRPRP